jgi:hypothetical protein
MDLLPEIQQGPLAVELAPLLAAADSEGIYEVLNRKDIPAYGKLESHNIKQYLSLERLRIPIMDSPALACREATLAMADFPVFDLSNPMILATFESILDGLVAEEMIPDFTEVHKATILYLATTNISRAQQIGQPISIEDVRRAIWNDDGSRRAS